MPGTPGSLTLISSTGEEANIGETFELTDVVGADPDARIISIRHDAQDLQGNPVSATIVIGGYDTLVFTGPPLCDDSDVEIVPHPTQPLKWLVTVNPVS